MRMTDLPPLGQGTWNMGDRLAQRKSEIAALRTGIELGMRVIDTAEMYGDGRSESLVAEAIAGLRDELCLVSKVLPSNASRKGVVQACEASLHRLKTDRLDVYLLHWSGSYPLVETMRGFEELVAAGKTLSWGVSNLDLNEMRQLTGLPGGSACATNQVLYNLTRRGIEFDLLPWCQSLEMPLMAYSPVEQGRLLANKTLKDVARRLGATPAQVALAWVLRQDGVVAIPKAASVAHVRENHKALGLRLDRQALSELDAAFPPPKKAQPLEML
jgi:diketogulonate reductase-like aldo/keto reductase